MAEQADVPVRLQDLTLIIPTFERAAYLERALDYWSTVGVHVIVVDGSAHPVPFEGGRLPRHMVYLHRPVALQTRLRDAVTLLSTRFAMLCSDDEFMLPAGLLECMRFLLDHPDYSVCCGRVIGYRINGPRLDLFPLKLGQRWHTVNQGSVAERIAYHIGSYQVSTVYGVHRTECLQFCISHAMSREWSNAYAGELGMELLAAAHGKSAVLSTPSWLRSQENTPVSHRAFNRSRSVEEWLTSVDDAGEVEQFTSVLTDAAAKRARSADRAAVADAVHQALNSVANRGRASRAPDPSWLHTAFHVLANQREAWRPHPLFRAARIVYRALTGRDTDNAADYFESPRRYKLSQLIREHGVVIEARAERELLEIFARVCAFHAQGKAGAR